MVLHIVDSYFDVLGKILSQPADQLRMAFCLIFTFPLGLIFKKIDNPTTRHTLSILFGALCQYLIYRGQFIHPLIMGLFTYYILKFFGRDKAMVVALASIAYLSIFHIYRMITAFGSYNIDVSTVLMIYTCKVTSFAWCVNDGALDDSKLSADQKERKIVRFPSLFEYLSFLYFFGNTLVGPACEYVDHDDFIHKRGDYAKKHSSVLPALAYYAAAFSCIGTVVLLDGHFNGHFTITEEYASWGLFHKFVYLFIAMQVKRCMYYSAWLLGTGSATAAGLNWNPNGKDFWEKYGKIVCVKPLTFEMDDNVKTKIEAWNTRTQVWLKHYVYFRIVTEEEARTNPKKATHASNITFMTSAFWHGFYPGYYFGFFWMFLAQQIAKSLYRMRGTLSVIPEPIGFIIRWTLALTAINLMGNTFVLMEVSKIWKFYSAIYFIPCIALIVLFCLFTFTSLGKAPRKPKTEGEKKVLTPQETKKE